MVDLYSIALFLHIAGAMLLVALLTIEGTGYRLGFNPAPLNRVLGPISAVLILGPGLYMVIVRVGWIPWVLAGIAGWVLIAVLGAGTGVALLQGRIQRSTAVASWGLRLGLVVVVLFLMTVKPGAPA